MLTGTHTNTVIPSRRLILVAKVGSNGLEAKVSVKCTYMLEVNHIAVPIELHSAVRGKYLPENTTTNVIYISHQLGESTYLKCHY